MKLSLLWCLAFLFLENAVALDDFHEVPSPLQISEEDAMPAVKTQDGMRKLLANQFEDFQPELKNKSCLFNLYKELSALNVSLGDAVTGITVKKYVFEEYGGWKTYQQVHLGLVLDFEHPRAKNIQTLGSDHYCMTTRWWYK